MIKDYDEMLAMVQVFTQKAQNILSNSENSGESEAIEHLREAMRLIYSRPDSDNMVAKLIPEIRRELVNFSAFEDSVSIISSEALANVKNTKAALSVQATSLFILENILAQIQPEIGTKPALRRIAESIRDANIQVSLDIIKERKTRGMFKTPNPSEIAQSMLKKVTPSKSKK